MKRKLLSLILSLTIFLSLSIPAEASGSVSQEDADILHTLGLFNGVGTNGDGSVNYDLDRAPSRQEAVTMLVRLLGKEQEALAGTWNTPFTDVDNWAKPYVGYAYTNGLTNGTGATTFGGSGSITATQYITFILRALGYVSGTDFAWDRAWELSDRLDITGSVYTAENNTEFLRRDVAAISVSALSATLKNSGATLLDTLMAAGAVTQEAVERSGILPDAYTLYARQLLELAEEGQRHVLSLGENNKTPSAEINKLIPSYDMYAGYAATDDLRPYESSLAAALKNYVKRSMDGDYAFNPIGTSTSSPGIGAFAGYLFTDGTGIIKGIGYCARSNELTIITFQTDSRPFVDQQVTEAQTAIDSLDVVTCTSAALKNGKFIFTFESIPEEAAWMYRSGQLNGYSSYKYNTVYHSDRLFTSYLEPVPANALPAARQYVEDAVAPADDVTYIETVIYFYNADGQMIGYSTPCTIFLK